MTSSRTHCYLKRRRRAASPVKWIAQRPLLEAGYEVTLRPHPQSYVSESELLREIEEDLSSYDNIAFDQTRSAAASMAISDILISDITGIMFDYAYLFTKPVIVVDCEIDRGGYEAEYVEDEIWEVSARENLGQVITQDDFPSLPSIVDHILQSFSSTAIESFREQSLYNFGNAGEAAAGQLIEIMLRYVVQADTATGSSQEKDAG